MKIMFAAKIGTLGKALGRAIATLLVVIFQKTWKVLPVVIVLASLLTVAYYIYVPMEKAIQEKPPAPPEITATANSKEELADQQLDQEEIIPSTGGRIFVFLILSGALIAVGIAAYKEKRGVDPKIPWGNILLQPVFIAVAGIFILNALANLSVYSSWRWFWDHQTLFWGTNMSLILFAHFATKKEPYAKFVARGIGLFIFLGFATAIHADYKGSGGKNADDIGSNTKKAPVARMSYLPVSNLDDAPPDVAFPIIAGCESGDGTSGSGRQFEIKNGEKVVVRGRKNSNDVGYLQINTEKWADLIKEHPEIDIARSEEDNIAMAELIRQQKGYQPWYLSQSCWGPQLTSLGYGHGALSQAPSPSGVISLGKSSYSAAMRPMNALTAFNTRVQQLSIKPIDKTVKAPIGESWSHATPVPFGFKQIHLNSGDKKYTVRWNNGVEEDFPTPEGATPKTPEGISSLQVKSRESEPVQIRIRIF